jgi:hypothetical protein
MPRRSAAGAKAGAKFRRFFPGGFTDETYNDWERDYKWRAHEQWSERLGSRTFATLLRAREYDHIARTAIGIEARTNLLFSFEKMALRDAVRTTAGAKRFAEGLDAFLRASGPAPASFERWCATVGELPRRQTRVLTWPLVTVFGFIAQPDRHIFLKPNVTRRAARVYGFDFTYQSRPNWDTYASLLAFAAQVRRDQRDLRPRDMIDLQSFIWVTGSDEYDE